MSYLPIILPALNSTGTGAITNSSGVGTVSIYLAGTLTLTTTYADSSGITPNSNPMNLDASGLLIVYANNINLYKFIFKDYLGNVIRTIDNVPVTFIGGQGDLIIGDYSIVDANLAKYIKFTHTSPAVNYFQIQNSISGSGPTLSVLGTDSNIALNLTPLGTGKVTVTANALNVSSGILQLTTSGLVTDSNSATLLNLVSGTIPVNYPKLISSGAGVGITYGAAGSDTDVSLLFTPKGAGASTFTTGNVNITAGSLLLSSGSVTITSGNLTLSAGNVTIAAGNITHTGTYTLTGTLAGATTIDCTDFKLSSTGLRLKTASDYYGINNHKVLSLTDTTSAVNYYTFSNSNAGADLTQTASGTDTDISFSVTPKGAGHWTLTTGNMIIQSGTFQSSGSITSTGGNITASSGNIVASSGTISDTWFSSTSAGLNLLTDLPINDSSGNEYFKFSKTASAINEFTITNAASGSGPQLSATGDGTDIDISFLVKGAGVYNFKATASGPAEARFFEATGTGTNYVAVKTPSSLAANTNFILPTFSMTMPTADGSAGQYMKTNASGVMSFGTPTGMLVQRVSTETGAVATGTTAIPFDDTIPQNTEGDQYMSLSITPTSSSNILVIDVCVAELCNTNASIALMVALFQDSTANALAVSVQSEANASFSHAFKFTHIMTAGTTSSTTFKVRAGGSTGATTTFNGSAGGRKFGGVLASSIMIREYTS